jgi:alkanesulfonate monooxygenase SsuD/methylene tetrahydromethanopterin reductase-like flavin-dependent oxidoreductase (luciferase family)
VSHAAQGSVRPLEYGFFTTLDNRDHKLPYKQILDNFLEQTIACEQAGFGVSWTGEHHFGYEGVDVHPNPVVTGAYLAAHTERIRIGFAGLMSTEWNPLRLAEDVALLDQISGGRVECGLGRGIAVRELVNLNLDADRRNDARNWALFKETVDIVKKAWTEDPFTYDGLFHQWPVRGVVDHTSAWHPRDERYRDEKGHVSGLSILPKPLQSPHPPLWNVVDGTPGFRYAAEAGMRPVCWLRTTNGIVEAYQAYRETVKALHAEDLALGERCGLLRGVLVTDTLEEAKAILAEPVAFYFGNYVAGHRGRKLFVEPGEEIDHGSDTDWFDFLHQRDHLIVGTPEMVAQQIVKLRRIAGFDHLMTSMSLPGVEHESVMKSIDLFGSEVMPLVEKYTTEIGTGMVA